MTGDRWPEIRAGATDARRIPLQGGKRRIPNARLVGRERAEELSSVNNHERAKEIHHATTSVTWTD
jgi:hypothetical protein